MSKKNPLLEQHDFDILDMSEAGLKIANAVNDGVSVEEAEIVDIIDFCEHPDWGNFKLFPAQSMFFKIAYKLWKKYPFTEKEIALMDIEYEKWGIDLQSRCHEDSLNHFMMIVGRRGLKSSTIAMIVAYESYLLITKQNPQKYYNLLEDTLIFITNAASNEEQAKTVYNLAEARIKSIKFFKPYLDNSLDNSTEIALYTPFDLAENERILRDNARIPRGQAYKKENIRHGSIRIKSIPTSATGARGSGSIVVIFDEFAHFERPKHKGKGDPREILGGNKRTDEAMYRALTPSVATYGKDFKIFVISSPADKSGKCYSLYDNWRMSTKHYVQQFASWEVNEMIGEDHPEIVETKKTDPVGYRMEWAGEFVDSMSAIITDAVLANAINSTKVYSTHPVNNASYIITLDPAKASDPDSDTYTVAWGHAEKYDETRYKYYVDGLCGFHSQYLPDPETGELVATELDPDVVDSFVLMLSNSLRRVVGILYDQYNSTQSIHKFRKAHLPAVETTYTSAYKRDMYGNFTRLINSGLVEIYGIPNDGGDGGLELDYFIQEAKAIQRVVAGNSISYKHPESGPVTTDDYVDAVANLVYQLDRFCMLGQDYIKDISKKSNAPIHMGSRVKPVAGARVGSPFRGRATGVNIANRIHRK